MNMIKKKWLLPLMFILVLSVALVGCTNDADDTATDTETETETGDQEQDAGDKVDEVADDAKDAAKDVEETVRDTTYDDITLTPEDAFDKFMELYPEAKVKSLDLDKGLMEYQYVVEGYDMEKEYEVKINPVDGEVISNETEMLDEDDEKGEITKDHLAKVDSLIDKAKEEDASDSELDEWDISIDDGRVVIDIEIGATEYTYDMETEELIEKDM